MAKIRITQKGWEGFSDSIGIVRFVDGVSVEDVSNAEAERIGANISVEFLDKPGVTPNPAQRLIDAKNQDSEDIGYKSRFDENPSEEKQEVEQVPVGPQVPVEPTEEPEAVNLDAFDFNRQSLELIAEQQGIKGLRVLAEPIGVKGTAIGSMIQEMLKVKESAEKEATKG